MKRVVTLIFFSLLLSCFHCFAQNNAAKADDFGRIVLTSYLDASKTKIPAGSFNLLRNKLNQIATANGIGGSIMQRFIMTANVNVITKDITATAPPMHALTMEVSFYIGDGLEGTLFSSTSIETKGVGETEDKAFTAALKSIKPSLPAFSAFVEEGKRKIIEYYNANGDMYISKARALAKEERYDDAIYMLMCIPDVCKDVYSRAMDEVAVIFKAKINTVSAKKLAEAKAIWASGQDYASAESAAKLLGEVHPESASYKDALALNKEISKRVKELDEREWQYQLNEQKNEHEEQMAQIKAYKEIAVTQAKNQPKTIYYYNWW